MQFKTSTKISLKFTFFATVVLFFFSAVIFALFFGTWYGKQKERLYMNVDYEPPFLLEFVRRTPMFSLTARDSLSIQQIAVSEVSQPFV